MLHKVLSFLLLLLGSVSASAGVPDAEAIVQSVDWENPTVIELQLAEHNYSPRTLILERMKPYVLRLNNKGGNAHDMVGGDIFNAIAVKMVHTKSGRVVAKNIKSIYVRPKQDTEIWFVPVVTGDHSFYCSLPGHRDAGMEGVITIK